MYAQLPFDDPKTILKLGTHLFGRIKNEKQQAVLRAYLAQKQIRRNMLHREKHTRLCGTNAEVTIRAKLVRHFIISTIKVHFNRKDSRLC